MRLLSGSLILFLVYGNYTFRQINADILAMERTFIGALGIVGGFLLFPENHKMAVTLVAVLSVGVMGIITFVRYIVYAHSDAARLGCESDNLSCLYEAGFANLAI
jgi:hypothetical protein